MTMLTKTRLEASHIQFNSEEVVVTSTETSEYLLVLRYIYSSHSQAAGVN